MKFIVFSNAGKQTAVDVDRILYIQPYDDKSTKIYFGNNDSVITDMPFKDVLFNIEMLGARDSLDKAKIKAKYQNPETFS